MLILSESCAQLLVEADFALKSGTKYIIKVNGIELIDKNILAYFDRV